MIPFTTKFPASMILGPTQFQRAFTAALLPFQAFEASSKIFLFICSIPPSGLFGLASIYRRSPIYSPTIVPKMVPSPICPIIGINDPTAPPIREPAVLNRVLSIGSPSSIENAATRNPPNQGILPAKFLTPALSAVAVGFPSTFVNTLLFLPNAKVSALPGAFLRPPLKMLLPVPLPNRVLFCALSSAINLACLCCVNLA